MLRDLAAAPKRIVTVAGLAAFSLAAIFATTAFAQGTFDKVKKSKVMVAGNSGSYPPFEMMEGNKLIGFDVDMAAELGKRMGISIKWEVIDFKGIIAALTSKRVDVLISAITRTPERAKRVSFSIPYYDAGIGALYRGNAPIAKLDDLKGKIVGVQLGSSGEAFVRTRLGKEVKELKTYDAILLAVKDLENGRVDAVVNPIPVLRHNAKGAKDVRVTGVWDKRVVGINTRKEDVDLLAEINKHLEAMTKEGVLDRLDKKWFSALK